MSDDELVVKSVNVSCERGSEGNSEMEGSMTEEAMKFLQRLERLEGIVGRFSVYASRFPQYVRLADTHKDADMYIKEFNVKTPFSMTAVEVVTERMNAALSALENGDMDTSKAISRECSGTTYGQLKRK